MHVDPQAVVWKSPATTSGGDEEQAGKSAWWVDGRDGRWITDGLGLLKALRVLNVRTFPESLMVAAADAGDGQEGGREICEKALREKLPWCEKVIVSLHKK